MTFDPNAHMIKLRQRGGGMADYLPVAARIAWFREKHPDGIITIEAHTITEQVAVFHARVTIANGGSAEGWGSETHADFPSGHIEKASTKALGRALLALGYGTMQAGDELDEGGRLADAPVEHPLLATIRDDTADPKRREKALHNYYMSAGQLHELNRCAVAVRESGLPPADLARAYAWHKERLETGQPPAPKAPAPPASIAG